VAAQGYKVRIDAISTLIGVASIINAIFGGHPATVARTGAAVLAAPEAGPASGRYAAVVISAALTLLIALAAGPLAALLGALPRSYVYALAGVAIISALQDALEKSFGGGLRFGALVAFFVAATPFSALGLTSAVWALAAGVLASAIAERAQLLALWKAA
jgi:benzoate membrane transport protein